MDNRNLQVATVIGLVVGMMMAYQSIANAAVNEVFDESRESKRRRLKLQVEDLIYRSDTDGPQSPFKYQDRYARLIADPGRQY